MDGALNRVILDCVADGVFTVDEKFRITSFNRAAEKITGVSREDAIGTFCHDVFRADICEDRCAVKAALRSGHPVVNQAVNIVRPDGNRIPISVSAAVLEGDGRVVLGGVESFRDLSLVEDLRRELMSKYSFHDIISRNPVMQELFGILPEAARSGSAVLVQGPGGAGKELVARAIHDLSPRRDGPFVAVNCAAIPETLLESELFGYAAGAFAGATRDRAGRVVAAAGGTLLLSEVGEIAPAFQVKLLRMLEERTYQPLGSSKSLSADIRVIAGTSCDLSALLETGEFRDDLYYRLNVVRMTIPSLSERREDIPLLVEHFVARLSRMKGKDISNVEEETLTLLMAYDWPGNVRQLRNALEYAFVTCPGGLIRPEHLPREIRYDGHAHLPAPRTLEESEARFLREALARHGGSRTKTALDLGIHKTTLWRKMKKYDIE